MSIDSSFRKPEADLAVQAAGIGALADPVRRALYQYVTAQPDAVGREAAAAAVHVPVHTAKFHLDRLCDEGLLQAEYRRLSGRAGPGAGEPLRSPGAGIRSSDEKPSISPGRPTTSGRSARSRAAA